MEFSSNIVFYVIVPIIAAIIGAVIGFILTTLYQNWITKKNHKVASTIKDLRRTKNVSQNILFELVPGDTIEHAREILGPPTKKLNNETYIFEDTSEKTRDSTNSYLYIFSNCSIKITSKDNECIDSITLMPFRGNFEIDDMGLLFPVRKTRFGKFKPLLLDKDLKVTQKLIDESFNFDVISSVRFKKFALQFYIHRPVFKYYTFFGHFNSIEDIKEDTLDSEIDSICISNQAEDAYMIFDDDFLY